MAKQASSRLRGFGLTRRTVLAAMAAAASPLPALAAPRRDALHPMARAAAESPAMAGTCAACAALCTAREAEDALRAGSPGASTRAEWMAALPARARDDLSRGAIHIVEGRRLTRTEVQFFALGARLVGFAAA